MARSHVPSNRLVSLKGNYAKAPERAGLISPAQSLARKEATRRRIASRNATMPPVATIVAVEHPTYQPIVQPIGKAKRRAK